MAPPNSHAHPAGGGNNNRIGLALIAVVLGFYAFGLLETAWHLPSPNHRRRAWLDRFGRLGGGGGGGRQLRVGGSINLAKRGISDAGEGDDDDYVEEGSDEESRSGDDEQDDENADPIPEARWPVSIRDEDGNLEEVIHPGHRAKGHPDVKMMVPRFWVDDPTTVHQNVLMPRELAMRIGSCLVPDENGNRARGDDCPVDDRTVYVAIASYRDWQVRICWEIDSLST